MRYSKLFEEILNKPGMYVGNTSIERIFAFMDGYIHADWENKKRDNSDLYFGFQPWVIERLGLGIQKNWANSIAFVAGSEESAFEMTKKLWTEYKAEMQQQSNDKN